MKRSIWIFLFLLGVGAGSLKAQLASFNFSAASTTVSGWHNISGDPSTGIRSGVMNSITVSSVGTGNWSAYTGVCAYDGGGGGTYFPSAVMTNNWFNYNGTGHNLAIYNSLVPQFTISGLNKDSTYILRMTGSDGYSLISNPTLYTVAGATVYASQSLNCHNNATQGVTFQHIAPDASGVIKLYLNTNSSSDIACICGLQIFSGSSNVGTPAVAITRPLNGAILPEDGNVVITATASETAGSIAKVEFYADTVKIGEATSSPYTYTWVSPAPGNYQLTAKATDNVGTINNAIVHISVESLNYFWSTTGNIATGGDSSFIGTVDTNRLAIRTNNIERVSILGDGTVGIGTKDTKGYKLAVNGTAIFTKVKVKTAGTWPDYVFKKGYTLPELPELEQYLEKYHHLPGILSEVEIQRIDGLDMGEQQMTLLKKIEELTLYLIEENKKLKEQNRQLEEQNKRLDQQQQQIEELKKLIQAKK